MTITSATDVPAAPPNPEYCDVKGAVARPEKAQGSNSAGFESKLPANWNGKFIFNGVGGLAELLFPRQILLINLFSWHEDMHGNYGYGPP